MQGVGTAADRKEPPVQNSRARDKRGRLNLLLTLFTVVVIVVVTMAQGAGTTLLAREITLPPGDIAYWLIHDSPTTQIVGDGKASDKHRVIRWGDGGLYASSRRTYAVFGFKLHPGQPGAYVQLAHTAQRRRRMDTAVLGWSLPACDRLLERLARDDARRASRGCRCSGGSGSYSLPDLLAEPKPRRDAANGCGCGPRSPGDVATPRRRGPSGSGSPVKTRHG